MTTDIATQDSAALLEQVVVGGDLGKLTARQRLQYYNAVCESVGLNPLTRPFSYIHLSGRLVLYAGKECADALRRQHSISVKIADRSQVEDVWIVTAQATTPTGRFDESIGAVNIGGLRGEAKAHALMKAETKAKRRVTLSICGLGMLDETEVESIPEAAPAAVTPDGEIVAKADAEPSAAEKLDREQMMAHLTEISNRIGLKAGKRAELWREYCGSTGPDTVDITALIDLINAVHKLAPAGQPTIPA